MIEFILLDILLISLGIILYLMAQALPNIEDVSNLENKKNFLDRFAHSDIPEKMDMVFNLFLLKFLKKIKILTLKFDNALGRALKKIKPEENGNKLIIDFKEIIDGKEENSENKK